MRPVGTRVAGPALAWLLLAIALLAQAEGRNRDAEGLRVAAASRELAQVEEPLQASSTEGAMGGRSAICGRHPYMASLRNAAGEHLCSGVLVAEAWVLTAAHCVDTSGAATVVAVGTCSLDDEENENGVVEIFTPRSMVIHENYTGAPQGGFDLAMLRLPEPSSHPPIKLPEADHVIPADPGLASLGWGPEAQGGAAIANLHLAGAVDISEEVCGDEGLWGELIGQGALCAFTFYGETVCEGDAGEPLIQLSAPGGNLSAGLPDDDIVVGVTSFRDETPQCGASSLPVVFTEISSFRGWIEGVIEGSSPAPPSQPTPPTPTSSPRPVLSPAEQSQVDQELLDLAAAPDTSSTAGDVQRLLNRGANPDACCASGGRSALHLTAINDNAAVAEALLDAGANPDPIDSQQSTPLHDAAQLGATNVAIVLIEQGANLEAKNNGGFAPLHVAAFWGRVGVVQALVDGGADKGRRDNERGATPLELVCDPGVSSCSGEERAELERLLT